MLLSSNHSEGILLLCELGRMEEWPDQDSPDEKGGSVPRIDRALYHEATERILDKVGYRCQSMSRGKILVNKGNRQLYIDVAGKNLPYLGKEGQDTFLWETHVNPSRLEQIENDAR